MRRVVNVNNLNICYWKHQVSDRMCKEKVTEIVEILGRDLGKKKNAGVKILSIDTDSSWSLRETDELKTFDQHQNQRWKWNKQ